MITKAIIPVAGWGTRRLPITKSIEKCMLPVGNRPLVDYVVQDCIKAGVTDIYFVVAKGSTQLKQYYSDNDLLNQYLIQQGKNEEIGLIALPENVRFHYIEQSPTDKYGTAVPVALAAGYIVDDESALVLMGDDFTYNADGTNDIQRLIESTPERGNAILAARVSQEIVTNYGVLEVSNDQEFVKIIEKPTPNDAPSTLINISKYVLNNDLIRQTMHFVDTHREGEYYLTDVINAYVQDGGSLKVVEAHGAYLDGGTTLGWLHANRVVMGDIA